MIVFLLAYLGGVLTIVSPRILPVLCNHTQARCAEQVTLTVVRLLGGYEQQATSPWHDRLTSASRIRLATKSRNVRTRADKCRPPR